MGLKRLYSLPGHSKEVQCIAISPDEQTLISAGRDNAIKIWHLGARELLYNVEQAHSDRITAIVVHPTQKLLASASADQTIKLWNLDNGEILNTFTAHSAPIHTLVFHPHGDFLYSGSADKSIKIWNVYSEKLIDTLSGHSSDVYSLAISGDGKILVSGSQDKTIKIWHLSTAYHGVISLPGHLASIYSLLITPDNKKIVSASADKNVKLWNLNTGELIRTFPGHLDFVNSAVLTPDAQHIITASSDKTIRVWNLNTGKLISVQEAHSVSVESVAISQNHKIIVSAGNDSTIKLWELPTDVTAGDLEEDKEEKTQNNALAYSEQQPLRLIPESNYSRSNLSSQKCQIHPSNPDSMNRKELNPESDFHISQTQENSTQNQEIVQDYKNLIEQYQDLLDDNLIEIYVNEINSIIKSQNLDSAESKKAIGTNLQNIGEFLFDHAEYQAGSRIFQLAIMFDAQNADEYLVVKGNLFLDLKNFDSAEQAYSESLEVNPSNWTAILGKSSIIAYKGEISKALELIEAAVLLSPEEHEVWNQKGILLFQSNQHSEALKAFERALNLSPNNHLALENRKKVLNYLRKSETNKTRD